jgi:hypothetical protein
VTSGFNTSEHDSQCKFLSAPFCNNPGEAKRWKIANNLILLRSATAPGGGRPMAIQILPDLTDVAFQHNTVVASPGTNCWASLYFSVAEGSKWPLSKSSTHNLWITDNVLCRPPTGDWGGQGTSGLINYMGDPLPLENRFVGNVIFVPIDSGTTSFPGKDLLTSRPIRFADPNHGDYQLIDPKWTKTTDGKPPGVDARALYTAIGNASEFNSGH